MLKHFKLKILLHQIDSHYLKVSCYLNLYVTKSFHSKLCSLFDKNLFKINITQNIIGQNNKKNKQISVSKILQNLSKQNNNVFNTKTEQTTIFLNNNYMENSK